jgi:hypothetical protein
LNIACPVLQTVERRVALRHILIKLAYWKGDALRIMTTASFIFAFTNPTYPKGTKECYFVITKFVIILCGITAFGNTVHVYIRYN